MERPPLDEWLSLFQATVAAEGITTAPGAAAGTSIIDAALIGAGANSFVSMLLVLYPGQPRLVDSQDITAFDNITGEVTYSGAYKGVAAAIPAGVPYKIVTFRFVPAEVAALAAALAAHEAAQAISRAALGTHDTDIKALLATIAGYIDTEIAAIETKLDTPANFMADVSALALEATLTAIKGAGWSDENLTTIDSLIDAIKAQTDKIAGKMLFQLDMPWTAFTPQIVLSTVAGDKGLGSITIANIPAGVALVDARMMLKFSGRENTNAAVNSISGAQNIQAQKAVAGAWITGIALAGGEYVTVATSGEILGDVMMGTANIVAQVPANGAVMDFKWTQALAAQDNLNFNDCQVGLRIWYSV